MATVPSTNVSVTADKKSDWGTGYDGVFVIRNDNAYDVLSWSLSYELSGDFTWFSDGDLARRGTVVTLTPKDWNKVIKAGTTLCLPFGGAKDLPTKLRFQQHLPLVGDDPAEKTRGRWGPKAVAPYCDVCAYPTPDLVATMRESGLKYFTMAFITADRDGRPAWGGVVPLDSQHMLDQVRQVRLAGGDVAVSFGGANGLELAQAIKSIPTLVEAYAKVIDMYTLRRIDLDIEGGAIAEKDSVDRRNKALRILQDRYPNLQITYCLPVLPTGLTPAGEALVRSAKTHGVAVHAWHAMSMDYGDTAAPDPEGRMGEYAVASTEHLRRQAQAAGYADPSVGVIPMIGHNDVLTEFFRIGDARVVRDHFLAAPWMSYLGWWSTNRDRPGKGNGANPFDSGIDQKPWDFAKTFLGADVPELDPTPKATAGGAQPQPQKPAKVDARLAVTPAAWDAIQQEVRQRVAGKGEPFEAVLRDVRRRFKGLGPVRQRVLRDLCGTAK